MKTQTYKGYYTRQIPETEMEKYLLLRVLDQELRKTTEGGDQLAKRRQEIYSISWNDTTTQDGWYTLTIAKDENLFTTLAWQSGGPVVGRIGVFEQETSPGRDPIKVMWEIDACPQSPIGAQANEMTYLPVIEWPKRDLREQQP